MIPIYDHGTAFCVLTRDSQEEKIIYFELENDEIYIDYQMNWNLLLLDIMIQYFDDEIDDEISRAQFVSVGKKIGFEKSGDLYDLRNLPDKEYNLKYAENKKWRNELAILLGITKE